jgi:hypothetical protein
LGPFSNALIRTISTFGVDLLGPLSDALIRNLNEVGFGERMFFYGDESDGRSCPFSVLHRPRGFGTGTQRGPPNGVNRLERSQCTGPMCM